MKKIRFKNEEVKYLQYLLNVWEINSNNTKQEQNKEIRIINQLQKKLE